MSEKLKCPVCGYEALPSCSCRVGVGDCKVICTNVDPHCGVMGPNRPSEQEAIEAWYKLSYNKEPKE